MAKYFTFEEMIHTSTGCKNVPNWEQVQNLIRLSNFMDVVRAEFGKPIRVNCAFRSRETNKAVGGVATSAHLDGLACDVCAYSGKEADNRALLYVLEKSISGLDQLISYHRVAGNGDTPIRFIHVGLSKDLAPRKQRLFK